MSSPIRRPLPALVVAEDEPKGDAARARRREARSRSGAKVGGSLPAAIASMTAAASRSISADVPVKEAHVDHATIGRPALRDHLVGYPRVSTPSGGTRRAPRLGPGRAVVEASSQSTEADRGPTAFVLRIEGADSPSGGGCLIEWPGLTAEEEADDGTSEANSLGCASQQDSWKGARRGREEASKGACPDREEGASKAQATEEGLARQVDKSSTGLQEPLIVALASGRSACHHRGRVDACSRRRSCPAP